MKAKRLTSPSTHPNLEELTLGDFIRSHTPTFKVTLLAERPSKPDPKHPHESYMVMPIQYFLNTYQPDDFRIREGGWAMARDLKRLLLEELGKVW